MRPAARPVEHGELAVEALQHDLGRVLVLALLVLPFARLQRAFEVNLGAFLEVLFGDPAQVLIEDHHPMPFGALASLAGRLVAPRIGGGDAQIDHRPPVLHAPDLRILAEIADQNHLVHAACHDRSPLTCPRPALWTWLHPSASIPKFASFCGTLVCELRNRRALAIY